MEVPSDFSQYSSLIRHDEIPFVQGQSGQSSIFESNELHGYITTKKNDYHKNLKLFVNIFLLANSRIEFFNFVFSF